MLEPPPPVVASRTSSILLRGGGERKAEASGETMMRGSIATTCLAACVRAHVSLRHECLLLLLLLLTTAAFHHRTEGKITKNRRRRRRPSPPGENPRTTGTRPHCTTMGRFAATRSPARTPSVCSESGAQNHHVNAPLSFSRSAREHFERRRSRTHRSSEKLIGAQQVL